MVRELSAEKVSKPVTVICEEFLTFEEVLWVHYPYLHLGRMERWRIAAAFAEYVALSEPDQAALRTHLSRVLTEIEEAGEAFLLIEHASKQVGAGTAPVGKFVEALLTSGHIHYLPHAVLSRVLREREMGEISFRAAGFYLVVYGGVEVPRLRFNQLQNLFVHVGRTLRNASTEEFSQ